MRGGPEVSVVMGVCNGADHVGKTMESVLAQEGVDLELIVVDDGSSDGTWDSLQVYAGRGSGVRLARQPHAGLTRALMRGCDLATGELIARQDCGDCSLPDRLRRERDLLKADAGAVLASCGTRILGPDGDVLHEIVLDQQVVDRRFGSLDWREMGGTMHGTTMFRRTAYRQVGGYRAAYYVAQDLDLWARFAEVGRHATIPEVLYEARWSPTCISALKRARQIAATRLIMEAARRRRMGQDDRSLLATAESVTRGQGWSPGFLRQADAWYFAGSCLRERNAPRAREYFRNAVRSNPLHLKSWLRLLGMIRAES